jgi:hypothetical protein
MTTDLPRFQMNSFDNIDSDSTSSYHQNNSGYNDGYVWGHPDYDNNTQFSDSDYNHESRMSSSPLSQWPLFVPCKISKDNNGAGSKMVVRNERQ